MTVRAKHIVTVKEYMPMGGESEAAPWLMLELLEGNELPVLKGGFLGFDLEPGTTLEQAKELARLINDRITFTTYTK